MEISSGGQANCIRFLKLFSCNPSAVKNHGTPRVKRFAIAFFQTFSYTPSPVKNHGTPGVKRFAIAFYPFAYTLVIAFNSTAIANRGTPSRIPILFLRNLV